VLCHAIAKSPRSIDRYGRIRLVTARERIDALLGTNFRTRRIVPLAR